MQAIENKKIKDQQDEKDSEKKKLADKKARNKKKSMPIDFEQKWKEQVCNYIKGWTRLLFILISTLYSKP